MSDTEDAMKRIFGTIAVSVLILCMTGCISFDNSTVLNITYYMFIENDGTKYSVTCEDSYFTSESETSMSALTRGMRRYVYETYPSTSFGAALNKCINTDGAPNTQVYKYVNTYDVDDRDSYNAYFSIVISTSSDQVVSGNFQNTGLDSDVMEATITNASLGKVHVLAVYSPRS